MSAQQQPSAPVKIPADVDRDDALLAGLTARQVAIVSTAAVGLYGLWIATREWIAPTMFAAAAVPIAGLVVAVALGRRDGIGLDRWLLAATRQMFSPRRRIDAPEGVPDVPGWITGQLAHTTMIGTPATGASTGGAELPVHAVSETGVLELGTDGIAAVAAVSSVNFDLRTPGEQQMLVATFARYLHALTSPVQILIRTHRIDLAERIGQLRRDAAGLPNAALADAAREHATFLDRLAGDDVLTRQVLLVVRERLTTTTRSTKRKPDRGRGLRRLERDTTTRRAAEARLARNLAEASALLRPAGITVTALDADQAAAVLDSACRPDSLLPTSARTAAPGQVITTAAQGDADTAGPSGTAGWPA